MTTSPTDHWPFDRNVLQAILELQAHSRIGPDGRDLTDHLQADAQEVEQSVNRLRARYLVEVSQTGNRRMTDPYFVVEHLVLTPAGVDALNARPTR